jgi:hypothetical protein
MPQDRKIIDFRNRQPVLPFKGLYDLKANFLMKAGMKAVNRGANTAAMAQDGIGTASAMKLWWQEIDEAGINVVVVNGRYAAGLAQFTMDNDALLKMQNQYKGRLYGLAFFGRSRLLRFLPLS